jgi:FkbM family methyltransferase
MDQRTVQTCSMPWLGSLEGHRAVADVRGVLATRHPAFTAKRLQELAIVGAADEGRRLFALCTERGIAVRAVVDDDPGKHGMRLGSHEVSSTLSLEALDRATPIVVASHRVLEPIERLRRAGFTQVGPFALLQVLDPEAFPPHMFYRGLIEDLLEHRDRYVALAALLADDLSRRVLDAVIGFRLTLDAEWLRPIVEPDLYAPRGLLTYREDEVYVDAGSYDGDTIKLFIERVQGRFARILAFEPDRATFERLVANFSAEGRVEPFNMGLHRARAVLHFDNAGTRGSTLIDGGGSEISVTGLDEVARGGRVTYVKMNIEGAEIEALRGAGQTIQRWRPKLAVSAYHHPADLWRVPETIQEIDPRYRLYLRQHDGGIIESVVYALP